MLATFEEFVLVHGTIRSIRHVIRRIRPRQLRVSKPHQSLPASLSPVGLLLILTACGGSSAAVAPPVPTTSECLLYVPVGSTQRDTISVALPESDLLRFELAHSTDSALAAACGTGPWTTWRPAASGERLLVTVDSAAPVLRLIAIAGSTDPRDLVDRQVEVILTADPAALEYARAQPGREVVSLAWATTYALVIPDSTGPPVETSDRLRAELAGEVVRGEARPAADSGWWNGGACSVQTPRPSVRLPDIMVPAQDPVARAIAERLIALAPAGSWSRITPVTRTSLEAALRQPAASAFVVPLPRVPAPNCQSVPPLPARGRVIPLIDLRMSVILGPGALPFLINPDGSIRFQPAS